MYKQLWHARYPNLAFIGLPHSVVPFPLFELQAEAVWKQWTSSTLPDLEDRLQDAEKDANLGGAKVAGRIEDTHYLGSAQWDYCRMMAKLAGLDGDKVEAYISTNKVSTSYADHKAAKAKLGYCPLISTLLHVGYL